VSTLRNTTLHALTVFSSTDTDPLGKVPWTIEFTANEFPVVVTVISPHCKT